MLINGKPASAGDQPKRRTGSRSNQIVAQREPSVTRAPRFERIPHKPARRETDNAARVQLARTPAPPAFVRILRDLGQGDSFPSLLCAIELFTFISRSVSRREGVK